MVFFRKIFYANKKWSMKNLNIMNDGEKRISTAQMGNWIDGMNEWMEEERKNLFPKWMKCKTSENSKTKKQNDRIMNIDNTDVLINNLGVNYYCCCSSAYLITFIYWYFSFWSIFRFFGFSGYFLWLLLVVDDDR